MIFHSFYEVLVEIKELTGGLAKGTKHRFITGSVDKEIIDLSQNLDATSVKISDYQKNLKDEKTELEQAKKELQQKVADLEKFYNLTVGREMKMVELKKKMKEMEKETKK